MHGSIAYVKFQQIKAVDYSVCVITLSLFCFSFSTAQWKDLFVGDVLRIHKDQVIPVRFWIYTSTEINSNIDCVKTCVINLVLNVE